MQLITQALEFGHNLGIRRLVGRLFPYADRWWFPPLTAALSAAATLSLTIPVVPLLIALVALNPRRWRAVVVWSVLGSALAGTLFTHLLGHFGSAWMNERMPQLAASKHWHYLVSWVSSYGFVTLAVIAASPFAQTPALILAALLGLPWPEVLGALLLGKGLKYFLVGAVTARTTGGPQGWSVGPAESDRRPPTDWPGGKASPRPYGRRSVMDLQFLLAIGGCRCRSPSDVATPRASLLHRLVDEPQVHTVGKEVRVS